MYLKQSSLSFLLVFALLCAACTSSLSGQPAPTQSELQSEETPDRNKLRPTQSLPTGIETLEIPKIEPGAGEVPHEIISEITAELVERIGAEKEYIQVVRAEAVVWNDGALGCPEPGEFYIQMLINGYWEMLDVEGVEYDYRVSDMGSFKLCEGESMPPISSPDTGIQNPLVIQAKEDLAERLDVPMSEIELLKIEEVTWRDGSLGCPQPSMFYTQALVNGSLIQLLHDENIFQYHSGRSGAPFLCENPPNNLEDMIAPPGFGDQ